MRVRSGDKRKRVQRCENESAQTLEEKYQFEHVTEAADFLMRLGDVGVYSKTNEEFISEKKALETRAPRATERRTDL
ncbi:uncharacterized protein PHALS_01770 [Plasmopara halstedii]|uniref:Uncharacterized protein n=1 Tax=Plasmopara halstedii TaxID=4781 RepID=A0A0P1AT88_PLAHL|nr:uncharacterized protein PHALS_01770 [Plasmopara halstedii]CEG45478.1 hypothetical protein PHALS_01770 [Plasmopara halstedii]|eukprot:XP_024581847.1 hypothetical protein PHALS_01770 [Plasmopara halstedii]